jgi:hypothetical protein
LGFDVKLNLGVLEVSYSDAHGKSGASDTGTVAEILEQRYHVMETFYESRKEKIAEWLAEAISDQIADIVSGGRPNRDPFYAAMQNIEAEFRAFLDANEMAHIVSSLSEAERDYFIGSTGGFTGAGARGVNHRKKKPYSKDNAARPVFVDTSLYQQSFRSWPSGTE